MMVIFIVSIAPICLEQFVESLKTIFQNKDFCNVAMPSENKEMLHFNQSLRSDKVPFISYVDLESLTPTRLGFLKVVFSVGDSQFDPLLHSYFKKN